MNLTVIIQQFSKEESNAFRSYLQSKNKRQDTKNIRLYNHIRKGTPIDQLDKVLYGKPNRNAFHALHKRLQDTLIDYIATRNFETETSEDMQVFKWILASRLLYEQNLPKPAHKLIQKATKKAQALDLYSALIESYHTQLQYSHLHPETDLTALTQQAIKCQQDFLNQENLNIAYAHLKRQLSLSPALLKQPIHLIIIKTFKQFNINSNSDLTLKSLCQVLDIINTAAHLEHNYKDALPFILKAYNSIQHKQHLAVKQRAYNIQILYYMANTFFRLKDFKKTHHYLESMHTAMQEGGHSYYGRFLPKYILIKSLTLNYSGKAPQAIALLEKQLQDMSNKKQDPDHLIALTVCYIQQENFAQALTTINKLKHTDTWYNNHLGIDWVLKKELILLIIYHELEYLDLAQSQLRRFSRLYKSIIKAAPRLDYFIRTVSKLHKNPDIWGEERFRESVKTQFTTDSLEQEDIFMLSFFAWIKAKIKKAPLYETTLELL